jgi:hypothetical protein
MMNFREKDHICWYFQGADKIKQHLHTWLFVFVLITLELVVTKKKKNQLLDSNGFEKEITGTEHFWILSKITPTLSRNITKTVFTGC